MDANEWCKNQQQMLDQLYNVAVELDARHTSSNCVVGELIPLSWDEVCDLGINILQRLKEHWKEIK